MTGRMLRDPFPPRRRLATAAPLALAVWMTASALAAPDEPPAPLPEGDLARLQGRWAAPAGPDGTIPIVLEITGRTVVTITRGPEGQVREIRGELRLDEAARPKAWDFLNGTGPGGRKVGDAQAIYQLDGDTLTLCLAGRDQPRPTDFRPGDDGKPPRLLTFRRRPDEPK